MVVPVIAACALTASFTWLKLGLWSATELIIGLGFLFTAPKVQHGSDSEAVG